jgi:hypothetical protein
MKKKFVLPAILILVPAAAIATFTVPITSKTFLENPDS